VTLSSSEACVSSIDYAVVARVPIGEKGEAVKGPGVGSGGGGEHREHDYLEEAADSLVVFVEAPSVSYARQAFRDSLLAVGIQTFTLPP
jgi:hypothetical protein